MEKQSLRPQRKPRNRRTEAAKLARWEEYERNGYPAQGDPIGFMSDTFFPHVKHWCARFDESHPHHVTQNRGWRETPGIEYLAEKSGTTGRYLRLLIEGQTKFIGFSQADKIAAAMDMPMLIRELKIVPNPNWTRQSWEKWSQHVRGLCLTDDDLGLD